MNVFGALGRAIGSGLVVPLSVGAVMALLVVVLAPYELAITIVVAVIGLLVGAWLCVRG